jgi:molecular chaperone GrpE
VADKKPQEPPPAAERPPLADAARLAEELEKLRQELAEAKDSRLRSQAELDNYRKRVRREMDDERRYAFIPLLRDLLPVLDNLDRAIQAAEKSQESGALLSGVKLVLQQFETVLERHHCRRIDALYTPFDPSLHQAILQQPSGEHPENTVLMVTQAGFQLHDRVVRPSQVIVSTIPSDAGGDNASADPAA